MYENFYTCFQCGKTEKGVRKFVRTQYGENTVTKCKECHEKHVSIMESIADFMGVPAKRRRPSRAQNKVL